MSTGMTQIALHGKNGAGKFMLVDEDQADTFSKRKWYLKHGYSTTGKMFAHHFVFHDDPRFPLIREVHHINGDRLDNRRENLEPIKVGSKYGGKLQNQVSNKPSGICKSKGITKEMIVPHLFRVRARDIDGKRINLGYYKTEEEGREVYEKYEQARVSELTRLVREEWSEPPNQG